MGKVENGTRFNLFRYRFIICIIFLCVDIVYSMIGFAEETNLEIPIKLGTARNLKLDSNLELSWDTVENASYYYTWIKFESNGNEIERFIHIMGWSLSSDGKTSTCNLKEEIASEYFSGGFDGENVQVSVRLQAWPGYSSSYVEGDKSSSSNKTECMFKKTALNTARNLKLDSNLVLSWDTVENASYYYTWIKFERNGNEIERFIHIMGWSLSNDGKTSTCNLKEEIASEYFSGGFDDENVQVSVRLQAWPGYSSSYVEGEKSTFSNITECRFSKTYLGTATDVKLDENLILSWKNVEHASYFYMEVQFIYKDKLNKRVEHIMSWNTLEDGETSWCDVKDQIGSLYHKFYRNHEEVVLSVRLQAYPGYSSTYVEGAYSYNSNYLVYSDKIVSTMEESYTCFIMPASVITVSEESFYGTAAEVVIVPDGCTYVGKNAFSNCNQLKILMIPKSTILDDEAVDLSKVSVIRTEAK